MISAVVVFCNEKVCALHTDYLERLRSRFRFLNGEMLKVYLQEDGYGCIKRNPNRKIGPQIEQQRKNCMTKGKRRVLYAEQPQGIITI